MKNNLLLAASGSIAAYKCPLLVRGFQERGFKVKMAATRAGARFVGEAAVTTLTGSPFYQDVFYEHGGEMEHISLADWADLFVVAPATANTIAKFAAGIADDLVSTLHLSVRCPILIAPAMNEAMWAHPSVARNIGVLKDQGVHFCDPGQGYLACGIDGTGRLADLDRIFDSARVLARRGERLSGKKALVTAGTTREALDPVRFLSNRSSGKMGYAVAEAFRNAGAEVTLISGPASASPPAYVRRVNVTTAQEMFEAVKTEAKQADILIMTAAVSDFRPRKPSNRKIKKTDCGGAPSIDLERTPDILQWMGENRKKGQYIVGFAAETHDIVVNAMKKFERKGVDLIALNDVSDPSIGFDSEDNRLVLIYREGNKVQTHPLPKRSKRALAEDLTAFIAGRLGGKS